MSSTTRRPGSSRAGLTTLVAILLLAGLAVALRSSAAAQGPATRTVTLKELDKQVITSPAARKIAGAVTGGTGAYAGARGVLVSTDSRTGSDTTITLET